MRSVIRGVVTACVALAPLTVWGQARPTEAIDVLKTDIDKVVAAFPNGGDQQIAIAPVGRNNVGIAMVRWPPGARGVLAHSQVDEIYYMIAGTGTLLTGGTMPDAKPLPADGQTVTVMVGPSTSAARIERGQSRRIGPGDIVIIPAGVPHQWTAIDSDMQYVIVRIDPDRILPAGYVHPQLKK